jgi:hypothetical protein
VPRLELLEERCVLTTINFLGQLGSAAQFTKAQTSLTMTTIADVEVGNSVVLEFAVKPTSKVTGYARTTATASPGRPLIPFSRRQRAQPQSGRRPGAPVRAAIFSLRHCHVPIGTEFTVTFAPATPVDFSYFPVGRSTELAGNM